MTVLPESLRHQPTRRDDTLVFATTVAMRCVVIAAVLLWTDTTFVQYARKGDGESYVLIAEALLGRADYAALDVYHHRVFLGYPALMALVALNGIPVAVAGLMITVLSAGAAAVLAGRVFSDRRVGWASAMFVPHWAINSSLVMTEAPALALSLLGAWAAQRSRFVTAGIALGMAGLVRPMTCFAAAGVILALIVAKRFKPALLAAGVCGIVFFTGLAVGELWRGDAFAGVREYRNSPRAYGGELFSWPFGSLLRETRSASPGKSVMIWAHVAFVFAATAVLLRRLRYRPAPTDWLAAVWLIGNTLFVLCIGSVWGFLHFHRFHLISQPPLLSAVKRVLPQRTIVWLILAAGVTVFAVFGVKASP